jgi:tetratricopeptide (TPR) repeat protein
VSDQRFKGVTWSFGETSSAPSHEAYQQLQKAEALRQQEQFDRALTLCEPLVARNPDYYGALYTLGLIYADKMQYPQALGCLVRAAMLAPRSWQALTALSAVYLALGASEMAAQTLEQARQINPHDASIFTTLGEIYRAEREYESAYEAYRAAVEIDADLEIATTGVGMCSLHLGRYAEAAAAFEGLVARGRRSLITLTALADLPPSLVTSDVLSQLAKVAPDKGANKADFDNSVAVIKAAALDKAGRPQEAWQHLAPANRSIFLSRQQDVRKVNETQRASYERLKDRRITLAAGGPANPISLFILGPSRSGKTTMETLMATLPGVKRGYENPIVENSVRRAFQMAGLLTSKAFDTLPPMLDSQAGEIYLEELSRRAASARVFTNTHPARIHDAARVASVFPNVRFVFVKRNLDDNMLRIFMREYAVGNSYAYDLRSTREHILWYHQMIDALAEKLPQISRVIHYEDIIADPAAARQLGADVCGLPIADAALPELGDDRNCAEAYRELMAAELERSS